MNNRSSARLRYAGLRIYTAIAWSFCILFYASVYWKKNTLWIALAIGLALGLGYGRIPRRTAGILTGVGTAGVFVAAAVLALVTVGGGQYDTVWGSYIQSVYEAPDKVMVIVAHEDDDLNLGAGVIDSYREAGTQVKVVFFTNGDYRFKNAYRQKEAIRSQKSLGVPEGDVIFMGYGDRYRTEYGHLYNAPEQEIVTSHAGYTSTYGLKDHPEYRRAVSGVSSDYTRANAVNDMKELLDRERPDVIYCVDQDSNPDHRATGLFFEEALGLLLSEGTDYRPEVYKGFAYSTAWSAREDYYGENVPSTVLRYKDGRMDETNCYLWENRLRLPVRSGDLAYTVRASGLWPAFRAYGSQKAILHMTKVINSDKVYWRRRTDSVLYSAAFGSDNGGDTAVLHDFKLVDSVNVEEKKHRPYDNVWACRKGDRVTVRLAQPSQLEEIVLYDNPSMEDNVISARITMDNGKSVICGPLEPGGAGTSVRISDSPETEGISGFTVEILETEGENAGLSEIEAYETEAEVPQFIKLTDSVGNFLYTYTPSGEETICLKLYGSSEKLEVLAADPEENFVVTVDGVPLELRDGGYLLDCPEKKITVRAQLISDPTVYDEIVVKPYSSVRAFTAPCLRALDTMVCGFETYLRYYMAHGENLLLRMLSSF